MKEGNALFGVFYIIILHRLLLAGTPVVLQHGISSPGFRAAITSKGLTYCELFTVIMTICVICMQCMDF